MRISFKNINMQQSSQITLTVTIVAVCVEFPIHWADIEA